jgi:dihydrofolate reductase
MTFSIVVATDKDNGIGLEDNGQFTIPWTCKTDMKFFKNITLNHNVIMGRNTYFSLPMQKLANRTNIVITRNPHLITCKDVLTFPSLSLALTYCTNKDNKTFVIGGAQLYEEAVKSTHLDKIYLNIIHNTDKKSNIFFPPISYGIEKREDTEEITYCILSCV